MARKMFVNLPVKDLNKSVAFFTALGFEFNPQFTDENATCMIINDDAFAMLLVEKFFKTFTKKDIADASTQTEVIVSLSAESREQVDELVNKALAVGGKPSNNADDQGVMYSWSFQDLDNHLWEVIYLDMAAIGQ